MCLYENADQGIKQLSKLQFKADAKSCRCIKLNSYKMSDYLAKLYQKYCTKYLYKLYD